MNFNKNFQLQSKAISTTVNLNSLKLYIHKMIKVKYKTRIKENTGSYNKIIKKIQNILLDQK